MTLALGTPHRGQTIPDERLATEHSLPSIDYWVKQKDAKNVARRTKAVVDRAVELGGTQKGRPEGEKREPVTGDAREGRPQPMGFLKQVRARQTATEDGAVLAPRRQDSTPYGR